MIKLFYPLSVMPSCLDHISVRRIVRVTYDEGADGAESSDALARAVVKLNLDDILLGLFQS
jgi:hypothetical protein